MSRFEDRINGGEFENNVSYGGGANREAHRAEEQRMTQIFRDEALKDVGLDDYELKQLVFDKAWSDGHSSGYMEVYYHLVDLAALIVK